MVNGTYICDKHDHILECAQRIQRLATVGLEEWESGDALSEIADLSADIIEEVKAAKLDGQKMETRLVERAAQGDSILKLARVFDRLAVTLENSLPADTR